MIKVTARPNDTIDSLLRRFNTEVLKDGILKEVREKAHYEKPSVKKRRKRMERLKESKNFVKY